MEIEKSKFKTYSFTIRKVKLVSVDKDTYMKHLARLPFSKTENIVFEYTGGLHMHGIGVIPNSLDKKRFRFRGWHIYLKELWDRQGWEMYLKKDDDEPDPEDIDVKDDSPLPKRRLFSPTCSGNTCLDDTCFETNREIPYDVDPQDTMDNKELGYYPYDPRSYDPKNYPY